MNFEVLKKATSSAIGEVLNGYKIKNRKIVVSNISFGDTNLDKKTSWGNIQKVKNRNGTLSIPIYGNVSIKEGRKIVSRNKKLNLGQLPVVTKNNSALVNGIEYTIPWQLRRDPGIYTSQSANGNWHTSINSGKGRNFKIENDLGNIQKIEIDGTKIPLLPILHHFGYNKRSIIRAWGNNNDARKIYDINARAGRSSTGRKALKTLYKKLIFNSNPNASETEMKRALKDYMNNNSQFNKDVNKITLGRGHTKLSPRVFLDISKKLINSSKTGIGDDTENLIFKHIRTAEDLIQEKIKLDFRKKLTAGLNRNLGSKRNVKEIVRPGLFTKTLKSFFNESKISEPSEQINPLHILSTASKITIKGEGGITDEHTVSMGMKSLHPSHFGVIDPLHTPDGSAGLVSHATIGTMKNNKGKLGNYYYDLKKRTGSSKIKFFDVTKTWGKRIASPDQYIIKKGKKPHPKTRRIKVLYRGMNQIVSSRSVDLVLASSSRMFDPATNMIPFINSNSGARISMGGKMAEQSISLINREAPNVSTLMGKKEIISSIGKNASIISPVSGRVSKVTKNYIEIKNRKGKVFREDLRNHMELNQESFYNDESIVKVGERVKKGQLIAKNNWIDDEGRLSLGVNARVAYMPYKGYSIEDGVVISESFAKKLTSQHLHVEEVNIKEGGLNLSRFKHQFKNKYNIEAFSKLDEQGIVKKGSKIEKGNILVAYAKPFTISEEDKTLKKVMRGFRNRLIDQSIVWNYDFPGEVVDVVKSYNLVKVKVKSLQIADLTDKVANRYGGKGIISNIIPDAKMPMTADGKPLEVILNPHGVQGRNNVGQLFEAALGKVTEKTGKRYLLENFSKNDNWGFVNGELKKNKLKANEKVIDPTNGKELKSWNPKTKSYDLPFVGNVFLQKLVHQTRKKFDARGRGAYSTLDMPGKNPEASHYIGEGASKENPKSVDRLTLYSLLAHGSKDVVSDMWNNKGQNRQDVWDSIISGSPIPPPKVSTATKKSEDLFRAAGINIERKGRFITTKPLTDKDTLELSSGVIPKPNLFLRGKDLMPIKGGMFDPRLTGGSFNDTVHNHIDIGVKIPNPATKNAIKILLNLKDSEFTNIMRGLEKRDGLTGLRFFQKKLADINVEKEIKKLETEKKTAGKTKINIINRKLRYLRAAKYGKFTPKDYLISKIPVIPTKFRPILPLPTGTIEPAPINTLYRNVAIASKLANEKLFPKFLKNDAAAELYKQVSNLQGITEPTSSDPKRALKTVMTELAGDGSPKKGFIHSKLLSKTQDYIGNAVIAVSPDLGIDEVGVPYKMADVMYRPFVIKELRSLGYKAIDYNTIKKNNPELIRSLLNKITKNRPVIINRNPSLHKGSSFAFNPKLISGSSIKLNPLILKPLNADFDGDQVPIHVPISKKAMEQAKTMIPSLNMYDPKNESFNINFDQEYVAGISLMSARGKKVNLKFSNIKKAEDAYAANKIRINDVIKIGRKTTTLGRALLSSTIPIELGYKGNKQIDKKELQKIMGKMVKGGSISKYTDVINKLKEFGAKYAYDEALSFNFEDIKPRKDIRTKILNPVIPSINKGGKINIDLIKKTTNKAQSILDKDFRSKGSKFYFPATVGSGKAKLDVMQQITVSPYYISGVGDKVVETPISKSYSEGLDVMDDFNASFGARKSIVDKVSAVSDPGAISKELIASFSGEVITMKDCKTTEGIPVKINDTFNLQNRVLAKRVNGLPANTILDRRNLLQLRKGRSKTIYVRSPLTCKAFKGVCAYSLYPRSMVYVKDCDNKIYHISLEDLFDLINSPINRIFDMEEKYPNNWFILDDTGWSSLQRVLRHPKNDRKMIEIGTDQGISLIATDDHPHVVYRTKTKCKCGSQLFSIDKRYKEKKNRSKNPHLLCRNCGNRFTVTEKELNQLEEIKVLSADLKLGDKLKVGSLNVEKTKDPDLDGYFLGLYLSEGSTSGDKERRSIQISQDENILKRYMFKICEKLQTKNKWHYRKKTIDLHDIDFIKKLKNLLGSLELCDKKKLPVNWLEWSDEYIGNVLAGFIDGDGHIRERIGNECLIGSTSYSILVQFQNWLWKTGVRASLKCKTQKPSHEVKTRKDFFHLTFSINQKLLDLLSKCYKSRKIKPTNSKYKVGGEYATIISLIDRSEKCQNYWVYDVTVNNTHKFLINHILTSNCYGYNEHHRLPNIGDPIGIKAAHSIGETGTQSALGSHHLGGTVAGGSFRTGFLRTKFILHMPDEVKNKAAIVEKSGTVTKIQKGIGKEHIIWIKNNDEPYITRNNLLVKIGQRVKAGQPLDSGVIKIQELAAIAPMKDVQSHMVKELEESYGDTKILRRNTETIVKNVTGYGSIVSPGKSPYLEEEIVPINFINWIKAGKKVPVEDVIGWELKRKTNKYPSGTHITVDIADDLLKKGIKTVTVKANGLKIKNKLMGINTIPLHQPDLLKKLSFQRIKSALKEGPISGAYSNIHGRYPEPAIMMATEFGMPGFDYY